MQIKPVTLPEFGLAVNWAMCRNPMCENFGKDLDVEHHGDIGQVSSERYSLTLRQQFREMRVATGKCRYCGMSWHLHSNHAVRTIARHYLSLSLPFAACPDPACENHGVNVFEHWQDKRGGDRPYRVENAHSVHCRACENNGKKEKLTFPLGTPRRTNTGDEGEARERPPRLPEEEVRERWGEIIEGQYAGRSITDTFDQIGVPHGSYYGALRMIGPRLQDYHSFRNARLLDPARERRPGRVHVYTDVMDASLQLYREHRRQVFLGVIVSTLLRDKKIFILAAHPFCLPLELCKDNAWLVDEGRPEYEREWASVLHPGTLFKERRTQAELDKTVPVLGRHGYFISPPYAQLAHFLVVQKMLGRFREIHCYMDGARDLSKAALVAFRDRIIAGRAEIVLYQHDREGKHRRPPESSSAESSAAALERQWDAADARVRKMERKESPLRLGRGEFDPRVRAKVYAMGHDGGFSKRGNFAWLRYPRDTDSYRNCRTLWLTRMPGKSKAQGKAAVSSAKLYPVDSIMNSMRCRIASFARPLLRSSPGRSYRSSYIDPRVLQNELSLYLLRQNYDIRRSQERQAIPAATWKLRTPKERKLDMLDCAWNFRLGIKHARRISGWLRT